ncbi:hypothetical protein FSP39_009297 [Pinctada imbricata]|uniref:Uncharacterized protein n=1 Tax=Pinctada imbricata TaxID=66713 RepID=A0AA89BX47_PINIB|nr:hypothetical protein FSP39_009297 [Pinctada imbricata]
MHEIKALLLVFCAIEFTTSLDFELLAPQDLAGKSKTNVNEFIRQAGTPSIKKPLLLSQNSKYHRYAAELLKTFKPVPVHLKDDSDWTHANNCGPAHSKIELKWSPKVIKSGGKLKVELNMVTLPIKQRYETDQLTNIPLGKYVMKVSVFNEKGQLFACVIGTLFLSD